MEVRWHGVKLVKLLAEASSLALPHPLAQELVAVSVLSISADRAPPLLSEASYYGEKAYASPTFFRFQFRSGFLFLLFNIKAIWLISLVCEAALPRILTSENAF